MSAVAFYKSAFTVFFIVGYIIQVLGQGTLNEYGQYTPTTIQRNGQTIVYRPQPQPGQQMIPPQYPPVEKQVIHIPGPKIVHVPGPKIMVHKPPPVQQMMGATPPAPSPPEVQPIPIEPVRVTTRKPKKKKPEISFNTYLINGKEVSADEFKRLRGRKDN